MADFGWVPAKLGWLAAFLYAAGTALRLARFNTQLGHSDKRYFVGLACPAAAAVMAGLVWVGDDLGFSGNRLLWLAFVVTIGCAALMVSNILYASFKQIDLKGRVPFVAILAVVLVFVFASIDPPKVFFTAALCYALSGPVLSLWRRHQRSRRREQMLSGKADDKE